MDGYLIRIYRAGAWLLFTRPTQIVFFVVCAAGLVLFTLLLNNPRFNVLGADLAAGALWLSVLSYVPFVIHEFGHAITAKHFGCEVYRGGVLLYYGLPAAFVDTTDVWLKGKRARLAVTWAGPYTGFIMGGLCASVVYLWPDIRGARLLFQLAFISILTTVINTIPMLKLDGYYLLSDALEMPRLRERSLEFLQRRLVPKVLHREPWTRVEWIFVVFGNVSVVSSGYFAYLGITFWNRQASDSWAQWVSRQGSLISLITNVLIILLATSSIVLGAYEGYRHGHRLVEWARRVSWLRQIPIFADFTGSELRWIAARLKSLAAAAGKIIFRRDEPANKFFIVETGEVSISLAGPDGLETEKVRLGPGEYFGEIALLMAIPRTASVRATRAATLLYIWPRALDPSRRPRGRTAIGVERRA